MISFFGRDVLSTCSLVRHSFLQDIEVSGFCGMHIPRRPTNTASCFSVGQKMTKQQKTRGEWQFEETLFQKNPHSKISLFVFLGEDREI